MAEKTKDECYLDSGSRFSANVVTSFYVFIFLTSMCKKDFPGISVGEWLFCV